MRLKTIHIGVLLSLLVGPVQAIQLPSGITQADFTQIVDILGVNSTGRLLRSAEGYVSFPGVRVGLEVAVVPMSSLQGRGFNNGSIPNLLPLNAIEGSEGDLEYYRC